MVLRRDNPELTWDRRTRPQSHESDHATHRDPVAARAAERWW